MTALELLICGALIGCSAFLSASEIAIFSLSRNQLRNLKERFKPAHKKIKQLQSDAGGVLITILIFNEIINVSLSTMITGLIDHSFLGSSYSWFVKTLIGVFLATPVLLILCEVTPKTIGARANNLVAPLVATPLYTLYSLMKPARLTVNRLVRWIAGKKNTDLQTEKNPLKEEEFLVLVEAGHREGTIQRSELDLIRNVFSMEETPASELMTPLSKISILLENMSIDQAIAQIRETRSARMPVLSMNRKKVLGIVYMKDLLRARLNPALGGAPLTQVMHRPLAVNRDIPVNRLFKRFRQSQTHIAIVKGYDDEPLGTITLDQILDDLLDELLQEKKVK